MRFMLSVGFAAILMPTGYVLGWCASYYFGDQGDVASALLTLLTVPVGLVCGAVAALVLAAKLIE